VAEAEHAVAAVVVQHGALEGDDPRPARGGGQVRIHRIVGIEIDEAGLRALDLHGFIEPQEIGQFRAQFAMPRHRGGDGFAERGVERGHALDAGVVQTHGTRLAAEFAQFAQLVDHAHAGSPRSEAGAPHSARSRPARDAWRGIRAAGDAPAHPGARRTARESAKDSASAASPVPRMTAVTRTA
jgi:hypothetical protein